MDGYTKNGWLLFPLFQIFHDYTKWMVIPKMDGYYSMIPNIPLLYPNGWLYQKWMVIIP